MKYLFTKASLVGTGLISLLGIWLGGYDTMLKVLLLMIVTDYVTGVLGALYNKKLNSSVGYKGIIRKVLILIVVGVATALNTLVPETPLREIVIAFYIANEGISFCENICKFIPVPEQVKQFFEQLREKEGLKHEG